MIGAIIGDIVGSRFERYNHKSKDFELFNARCRPTDDSMMTLAIAKALVDSNEDYSDLSKKAIYWMQTIGCAHKNAGYGGGFRRWLQADHPRPYNSYGNGAAMRISPVGWVADSIEEVKDLSYKVTSVTHNHSEGLKGAEATAICIYLARNNYTKEDIKEYINNNYYNINFTLLEIRDDYKFDVSCQGSVPQALECFFESEDYEDAIRNAISIGGDSDTIGAICGGIAEAYYGLPDEIKEKVRDYLDDDLLDIIDEFIKSDRNSYKSEV